MKAITGTGIYHKKMGYITWVWKTRTNLYCRNCLGLYINTIAWIVCLDLPAFLHVSKRMFLLFLLQMLIVIVFCSISDCLGSTLKMKRVLLFYNLRNDAQQSVCAAEYGDKAFQLSVPLSFCKSLFVVSVGTLYVVAIRLLSHRKQVHLERWQLSQNSII